MGETKRLKGGRGEADAEDAAERPQRTTTEAENEMEQVALQVPEGATGTVYCFIEGGKKAWCDDVAAADFSPQWIRDRFGPGRYVVYWRVPDPNRPGKPKGAGSTPLVIKGAGNEPNAGQAGPNRLDGTLATLVEQHVKSMLDGQEMLSKMQLAVLANLTQRPAQSDGFGKLLELILPELIKSLVNRPAPVGPDLAGIIALADKLSNRASPVTAMKDTLALLEQARELAGGDGEGTPAWVNLAARALDTIGKAVAGRPAGELEAIPDTTAPAPESPAPVPAGPTPEAPALPATAHAVFHFLAPHIPALLRHAIADHDATTYSGVIFDQLQPQYYAEVRDYIGRPDFLDLLEAHFPGIRGQVIAGTTPPVPVREWFTELRDDLVTRIQEQLNPPAEAEGEVH